MSDESDSAEAEDTSRNGVSHSTPLLNTYVENKDELKEDSLQTSETQEATSQDANDDQIHIDDIYVSFYVGLKLFDTALYVRLFFPAFLRVHFLSF